MGDAIIILIIFLLMFMLSILLLFIFDIATHPYKEGMKDIPAQIINVGVDG